MALSAKSDEVGWEQEKSSVLLIRVSVLVGISFRPARNLTERCLK